MRLKKHHPRSSEFRDGSIAQMMRDLEDELLQQIQGLESQKAASVGDYPHPRHAH
jgi:hypothetical protein